MRLVISLLCALNFVGITSQAYPVQIHTCSVEKNACCEPGTCKCVDCGHVLAPHAPVALSPSFQLHEIVTVESLRPTDGMIPFSLTYKPLSPPPKLARV